MGNWMFWNWSVYFSKEFNLSLHPSSLGKRRIRIHHFVTLNWKCFFEEDTYSSIPNVSKQLMICKKSKQSLEEQELASLLSFSILFCLSNLAVCSLEVSSSPPLLLVLSRTMKNSSSSISLPDFGSASSRKLLYFSVGLPARKITSGFRINTQT